MAMGPTQSQIALLQARLDAAIKVHKQGDLDKAEAEYAKILEKAPSQPDALNLLGVIQAEKNRNDVAVELISRAARLRPHDGNILNNLGRACVRARQFETAIDALERAIGISPDLIEAYGNLVQAHRGLGHVEEARYYINALRERRGGSVTADFEQARLHSDLGEKDEAMALYRRIVEENPAYAPAWHAMARMTKVKPGDRLVDELLKQVDETSEPSPSMKFLCYGLGKCFDDLGEYDRAFEYFSRAKAQDPATFDEQKTRAHFNAIKRMFDERFFERRADFGVASERPVFIVGMPRSGTSLIEQILASHPDVFGGGELEYIGRLTGAISDFSTKGKYPEGVRSLKAPAISALAFRYLRQIGAINNTSARFTDKMPHNFLSLGLIRLMFPNSKIIHTVRHPFDTCLSCYTHDFAHSHSYNRSFEGLATYYNIYRDLMEHWKSIFGDWIYELHYETLIDDQEAETKRVLSHLALEWDPAVLKFSSNARRVSTPSNWQVRQPLYRSSAGKWQRYARHIEADLSAIEGRWIP